MLTHTLAKTIKHYLSYLILNVLLLLVSAQASFSQPFEGIIHYKIHYEIEKGGPRPGIWNSSLGNFMDFYTDGCNTRSTFRQNEQELWSEIHLCDSQRTYYIYPYAYQALWHDVDHTDEKFDTLTDKGNTMHVLGFPCDHMSLERPIAEQGQKTDYFFSQQHFIYGNGLELGFMPSGDAIRQIPLATVSEGGYYTVVKEAVGIIHDSNLPEDLFRISGKELLPNGVALSIPPQPRIGYERWCSKLISSLYYPRKAARQGREEFLLIMITVNDQGKVQRASVVNPVDADFKAYVERVLSKIYAKWKPGIYNGQPVTSAVILPVTFLLP